MSEIEQRVNVAYTRIEQVLKTLAVESPPPVARIDNRWTTTTHPYDAVRRRALVDRLTGLRRQEQEQMNAYAAHTGCLMEFLARALDDPQAEPCGRCALCQGRHGQMQQVDPQHLARANEYLQSSYLPIQPRRKWPPGAVSAQGWHGMIHHDLQAATGRALCIYNDAGWGQAVHTDKNAGGPFRDELVQATVGMVRAVRFEPKPEWVTCVPSHDHPYLVPDLAQRIAEQLGLPFVPVVKKIRATAPQKDMQNSWHQFHNLDGAFEIDQARLMRKPVLLIDDVVDSRWTFTLVAALLRQAGSPVVIPIALAAQK